MVASVAQEEFEPKASRFASRVVGVCVLSSFIFGYSICVLNSCLDIIAVSFEWCGNSWESSCAYSKYAQGMFNASLYLGAALGALLFGRPQIISLGSRRQILIADVLFGFGAILCLASQGFITLTLGRFMSGVGLGISAIACPVYVAEISPRERRGANSGMVGVAITVGILASIAFGIPQSPPPAGPEDEVEGINVWYWRFLVGFPCLVASVQAAAFYFVWPVDPPAFHVQNGNMSKAREVLYRVYGEDPSKSISMADRAQAALELQLAELEESMVLAKDTQRILVRDAVGDPFFRIAVIIGISLAAFSQGCGINGLMAYSNNLFAQAGIAPSLLTLASTVMATGNVVASIISSKVVDSWGRRSLLIWGPAIQTVALLCLVIIMSPVFTSILEAGQIGVISVVCFTAYVMSYSFGLGAVTWVYLSEIYPIEIRSTALSACGVINWLVSFVVVFGTGFLTLREACQTFGMVCLIGTFAAYFWVVETKGCSMDDSPLTPRSDRSSSKLLARNDPTVPLLHTGNDSEDEEDRALFNAKLAKALKASGA